MKKLAILISNTGKGTNLQAIIDAIERKKIKAIISAVISDTEDAYGLIRAKKYHLPIFIFIISLQKELVFFFTKKKPVDYIVLAGWKKIIPLKLIKIYHHLILNLHPGLIPNQLNGVIKDPDGSSALWNRGLLAKKAINNFLEKKASYAGSSIHFLTEKFDFSPVLARCFEKILPSDTVESLYQRLKKKENQLYIMVLKNLCS